MLHTVFLYSRTQTFSTLSNQYSKSIGENMMPHRMWMWWKTARISQKRHKNKPNWQKLWRQIYDITTSYIDCVPGKDYGCLLGYQVDNCVWGEIMEELRRNYWKEMQVKTAANASTCATGSDLQFSHNDPERVNTSAELLSDQQSHKTLSVRFKGLCSLVSESHWKWADLPNSTDEFTKFNTRTKYR